MNENKITILLKDKDFINELLKDEDVKVRITDAILDGVVKRVSKKTLLSDDMTKAISDQIHDTFFEKKGYYDFKLKEKYKKEIQNHMDDYLENLISEQLCKYEDKIGERIEKWQRRCEEFLDRYDMENLVKNTITKIIESKFKK